MRFRLLEAPLNTQNDGTSNYIDVLMDKSASREDRLEACIKYTEDHNYKGLSNVLKKKDNNANKLFDTILLTFGYEQDVRNKCYFILSKLPVESIGSNNYSNFVTLCDTIETVSDFNHKAQYLSNPSLYDRSAQEFSYTLKVMDTVYNPAKLKDYYDPKKIDPKNLYDGTKIKPAGIDSKDPDDFDTIYGVLETWKETAPNENTAPKADKKTPEDSLQTDKKSGSTSKSDNTKTYTSAEEANKAHENTHGKVIRIDGKFMFNSKTNEWEPVKKR